MSDIELSVLFAFENAAPKAQLIPPVCRDCKFLHNPNDWESLIREDLYCRKGRFLPTRTNRCDLKPVKD